MDVCPKCQECPVVDTKLEYYKQMNEFKLLPWKERADISFQQIGMLWGYFSFGLVILFVGAVLHKQVYNFAIMLWGQMIDRWQRTKVIQKEK